MNRRGLNRRVRPSVRRVPFDVPFRHGPVPAFVAAAGVVFFAADVAYRAVDEDANLALAPGDRLELSQTFPDGVRLGARGGHLRLASRVELLLLREKVLDDDVGGVPHGSFVHGVHLVSLLVHLRVEHLHLIVEVLVLALQLLEPALEHGLLGEEVLHLLRELLVLVAAVGGGWGSERGDVALDGGRGELAELGLRAVLLRHLALLHADDADEGSVLRARGGGTGYRQGLERRRIVGAKKKRWTGPGRRGKRAPAGGSPASSPRSTA